MIELKSVTRQYGRRGSGATALRDVSLTIPTGSVWGVVGPNGAGKSTLLAIVLGFLRPTSGHIKVAGDDPRDYVRDNGAAYLPERFTLPPSWRVADALRMLAHLDGADASTVMDRLDLASHAQQRIGQLSRGTLQRVGIAQALLASRQLVVLDEPTEGLDPVWRIRLRDVVADMRARGATVLVSSHDLGEIERIADRTVILEAGVVRDVIDARVSGDGLRYRITLATSFDHVAGAFPAASPVGDCAFVVDVGSAAELTDRLGALIALGAVVSAVEPIREPLEDRVRAALREDA